MDPGEQITGTRDEHYNLIAVLYHALHGAENCDIYAMDAEAGGRIELSDFFREAQEMQRQLADRAKELLGIGGAVPGAGGVPTGGAMVGDVPPGTTPGDVPPMTEDVPPPSVDAPRDTMTPSAEIPPETPGGVPPETSPRGVSLETEDIPPDIPRTEDARPEAGGVQPDTAPLEPDVVPDTAPGDVPPRSVDVQREAQLEADEVGAPVEELPRTTDVPRTPPGEPLPQEEDVVVEPTERLTEDVPPRGADVPGDVLPPTDTPRGEDVPRTEEVPTSPSEPPPPGEVPPEAERSTGAREYFSDLIRETDRRSRGQI